MKNRLKYILTIVLIGVSTFVHSYPTAFRNLTVAEGLSDLLVNAIYKDSLGYVWIGTGNSLERFDGVHLKRFPIAGADEKLKRVTSIAELPGNEIWMGNGMGLWRVDKRNNTLEPIAREWIDKAVHSLLYDASSGTLYIGTGKGLYIYRSGNIHQELLEENSLSAGNVVTGMVKGDGDILWLATEGGLFALNLLDNRISKYHNLEGETHVCNFKSIARIGDMLYLATQDRGIVRFDGKNKCFDRYVDVGCNVISTLSGNGTNLLYVGTDGNGIHFIDTRKDRIVHSIRHDTGKEGGLHSNSVYSLLVDREGIIWVGFYQQGLGYIPFQNNLFTPYAFLPYMDTYGLPVRALYIREDEKLIGSRDGLFYVDERGGRFKTFKIPQLRSNMIFCIQYYQGEYYIGTYGGGMYILNPHTLAIRDFDPDGRMPFSKGHIFCIREDAEGMLWIGTSEGVYCYKDGRQVAHYNSSNSKLLAGNVYEIYFDSTRKGWICTENGLCMWDPSAKVLRTDVFPEGFIHKEKVRVVYEDSEHQLYFFPDKGRMFISDLEMTAYHPLSADTPLEGRNGMFVIEDREGWLWIGTDKGLFRYDKKDRFVPFHYVDGIPNPIFTLYPPVMDKSGDLWLANTKGLLHLDANRLEGGRTYSYPLTITDMFVDGSHRIYPDVEHPMSVELNSSQNNITIHFSDMSYTLPSYMAYECQLEGKDKEWIVLKGNSDITYYNLDAGNYIFKLRRLEDPDSEIRLSVKVAYDWGKALLITVVLVLAVATGVVVYRRRKKQPQAEVHIEEFRPVESEFVAEEAKVPSEEKYKTNRISQDECKRLAEALEKLMREEKPYINPDLKSGDLAAALGTSQHTLSYLFNQYLKRSYYDYVTGYRIDEFKRLVKSGEYTKYTLDALSGLCGFNSRASFFRSFKKITGVTPNDYISHKG